jgi:hypothetical protein
MNTLQTYDASVMAKESPRAMHVVVVPRRSLPSPTGTAVEAVLQELDRRKLAPTDPTNLARHLAVPLSAELPNHELLQTCASVAMVVRFAEFVSFERVIAFEESRLSQESLAKLATTASGRRHWCLHACGYSFISRRGLDPKATNPISPSGTVVVGPGPSPAASVGTASAPTFLSEEYFNIGS